MRLEHLRITAFGPFADTVEVDFEDLSAAGLFLLTGATGAGKSSVLDTVCFALYGVVAGDRSDAKHLRSDHAAPGAVPEVELRRTVRGRTFTFRRTAQWDRPKKRGTGTTRQQPTVCIEEFVGGEWQPLSTRMDEAGHLVTDLLGMNPSQFTQVAMLPQGRFQAFLRASSAERHAVLQRLFRTDRFESIEHWLAERRRQSRRDSDAHADEVTALLQRISEVAEEPVPEEFDELATRVLDDEVRTHFEQGVEKAGAQGVEQDALDLHLRARDDQAGDDREGGRGRIARHRHVDALQGLSGGQADDARAAAVVADLQLGAEPGEHQLGMVA